MVHVVPAAIDENVQIVEGGSIGGHLSEVDKHAESVAIVRNVLWNPQLRGRVAQIKIACAIVCVNVQLIRVVFQTEVLAVPPIQPGACQRAWHGVPFLFLKSSPWRLMAMIQHNTNNKNRRAGMISFRFKTSFADEVIVP